MNLDQFLSLERVGNTVYIGFNDAVERVVFPKLMEIDGALVIEANPRLRELVLPNLTKIGRYIHIHDNAVLEKIEMPKLAQVGGELSVVDNPKLVAVTVGAGNKPASTAGLEIARNAHKNYPHLAVDTKKS